MAKRDVQLVIRARSEADRAIDSISSALKNLAGVQDQVAGSGERTSSTLEQLGRAFATLDSAMASIGASVDQAKASMQQQAASLAENEARYASLTAQIQQAENAIVSAGIAFKQDGSAEAAARLNGAQAAYRELNAEAKRLEGTITGQRADVAAAGDAYEGLERAANAAQVAIGSMGDAGEREALRTAAAAREAEQAILEQARAAEQSAAMRDAALRARGRREGNGGEIPAARDTALADTLRLEEATEQAEAAENRLAAAAQMSENALRARARAAQGGEAGIDASATALADALREEEAAAQAAAQANAQLDAAAARLKSRLDPTRAAQDRLNAEMAEARRLFDAGKISIRELTAELNRLEGEMKQVKTAQGAMNRNGSAELKGVLGLRPYELQNLSYQINDLVTQIASGAPVSQAFAQQGGQIVQLFPKLLTGVLKYAKGLGLLALVLTPVIIGMSRMGDLAKMQRDFDASLRLSADGARYNTKALIENVDAIERMGASVEEATDIVKGFLAESVNPELLDSFAEAAENLAKITGQDLTEAAEDVAKAFTGGYEEIAEFDDKMNFLTLTEREQIRAMFDSGDASEARRIAFNAFYDDAAEGAADTETAWSRMTDAMGNAWQDFTNWLGQTTVFSDLKREIEEVAIGATYLINRLRGLGHEAAALDALGIQRATGRSGNAGATADPLDTDSERYRKGESDRRYEEATRNRGRRGRGRSGGKSLAELQAEFNREIEKANREREREAEFTNRANVLNGEALILEQRRQAIAEAIFEAEDRASKNAKQRLTLSQEQRDEIARTVGLEFDAKNAKAVAQAQQEAAEKRLNELYDERAAMIDALDFQGPGTRGFQYVQDQIGALDAEIEEATQTFIDYWDAVLADESQLALLGVTAEEVRTILKGLENDLDQNRQDGLNRVRAAAEQGIDDLRAQQQLLQEQIQFAQLQGNNQLAGNLSQQLVIVNERLAEGADKALAFWRAVRGNPDDMRIMGLTPEAVDNIILGLENSKLAAESLRTQFLATGDALNRDLAAGGTRAMEQFAQAIVNGENVLGSFARAFLQFAADFLMQIAQMIAQQAIFNALSGGSPGGFGGVGGGIAGLLGGLFHGGGVVGGTGGRGRAVAASIFSNATRYHGGGIAGLKPNEVPAILERGEEVLTRSDARHRNNAGGGGGGNGVAQVLAIGEEQIAQAIAGAAGRKVLITHIRNERATIRQELGIG